MIGSIDRESGFVVVPGSGRKPVTAAVDDAKAVPDDDPLVTVVQSTIGELNWCIDDVLGVISDHDDNDDESYSFSTYNRESNCYSLFSTPTKPNTGNRVEVL